MAAPSFRCPSCRGPLGSSDASHRCDACSRDFPVVSGIPDFRLAPDPYLSFEEDQARTTMVVGALERLTLQPLLEHYWSVSDVTPEPLRRRFVRAALRAEDKALRVLALLDRIAPAASGASLLEIGSGTGGFLAAAARRFPSVVGVDAAMRWLHLSRRRFMDSGMPAPLLVCAGGEHLPFEDSAFDRVVCLATLEFVKDAAALLAEVARVLRPDGTAIVHTINRYSLAPEPHVRLWGVGYLPRSLQAPWVRLRRRASFENVHLRSLREIRRLAGARFSSVTVQPADVDEATLADLGSLDRSFVGLYRRTAATAPGAALLRLLGPEWDVVLARPRPPEWGPRHESASGNLAAYSANRS